MGCWVGKEKGLEGGVMVWGEVEMGGFGWEYWGLVIESVGWRC